ATQAYQLALKVNAIEQMPSIQMNLGNIHSALGDDDIALPYFRKSIANALSIGNYTILSRSYYSMARLFSRANRLDSSFYYDRESYEIAAKASDRKNMLEAATVLASFFEKTNNDSTLKYLKITIALKDSLFNQEKTKQVQSLTINEQLRQQEIESAKKAA